MTMWWHSALSNLIIQIPHLYHLLDENSPSNLPELLVEEILESQEEYPREEVEGVEEGVEEATQEYQWRQHHNKG